MNSPVLQLIAMGAKGPCTTWEQGRNGRCIYCDHPAEAHDLAVTPKKKFTITLAVPRPEKRRQKARAR